MNPNEFRQYGQDMVEYIAQYFESVGDMNPLPAVSPGYLKELIPKSAPQEGDAWEDVLKDIDRVIMPGMTHWQSRHFHAYFPSGNSFPAILGDMLSDAFGCIGFSWSSSPACTELEVSMMNWLAKMLHLPSQFQFSDDGFGGGVIQGSASEATLISLLSARTYVSHRLREENPDITQGQIIDRLMCYASEEAHSSVGRAALFGMVPMRTLPTDENGSVRGDTLERAIEEDKAKGLIPFYMCAATGTTSTCAFDRLEEIGPVCSANNIWLHVDAAYAGSACICPEYKDILKGIEYCMSVCISPHKWMRVNYDCAAMWVQDYRLINDAFHMDPVYMRHGQQGKSMPDFRHWQVAMGRRFRSLKLWFMMRMFGVKRLQEQIRKDVSLAQQFAELVKQDSRFEMFGKQRLSLVCFRLKGNNRINETLVKKLNEDRRIHITPSEVKKTYFLRFVIGPANTQSSDVTYAWKVIQETASNLLGGTKKG